MTLRYHEVVRTSTHRRLLTHKAHTHTFSLAQKDDSRRRPDFLVPLSYFTQKRLSLSNSIRPVARASTTTDERGLQLSYGFMRNSRTSRRSFEESFFACNIKVSAEVAEYRFTVTVVRVPPVYSIHVSLIFASML